MKPGNDERSFDLVAAHSTYSFRAATESERERWMEAIESKIFYLSTT